VVVKPEAILIVCLSTLYGPEVASQIPHVTYFPERALAYLSSARDHDLVVLILPEALSDEEIAYFQSCFFNDFEFQRLIEKIRIIVVPDGNVGALTDHFIHKAAMRETLLNAIDAQPPQTTNIKILNAISDNRDIEFAKVMAATLEEKAPEVAVRIGSKSGSKRILAAARVPHPAWTGKVHVERSDVINAVSEMLSRHGRVCAKMNSHEVAGGIGNFYFAAPTKILAESDRDIGQYFCGGVKSYAEFWPMVEKFSCIIEEYVQNIASYHSALMFIDDKGSQIVSVQEQFIVNSHFSGFLFRPAAETDYRFTKFAERVANLMFLQGYRGSAGVDFVLTDNDEIFALEINARKTGVSHVIQFGQGVLRKYGRSFENDAYLLYRRGIFATCPEKRRLLKNVSALCGENAACRQKGDGIYFINARSIELNGFVEYVCIATDVEAAFDLDSRVKAYFGG
jgi:uncharacterized protein (UPF0254 family)